MKRRLLISILVLLSFAAPVAAQEYVTGLKAYKAKDYATAIRVWTPLGTAGDAQVQNYLAFMYSAGLGTKKDIKKAEKWYRKAADQGYMDSQLKLGMLYEDLGKYAKALRWYRKAAVQGQPRAQYTMARLYWNGRGLKKNDTEAAKWYLKSAEQNYAKAQSSIGYLYLLGHGVRKSSADAAHWFRRGADLGNPVAQQRLADLLTRGDGVEENVEEAYFWLTVAAPRSDGKLQKTVIEQQVALRDSLKPEQITEAETRAQAWRVSVPKK